MRHFSMIFKHYDYWFNIDSFYFYIAGLPLNDYIRHFEPAFYTPLLSANQQLHNLRAKRSLTHSYQNQDDQEFNNAVTEIVTPSKLTFNVTAHNR